MKSLPSFIAFLLASWMAAVPAVAEEKPGESAPASNPDAPVVWTSKTGSSITARFIRMSGDLVVIEEDARERTFSIEDFSEASARQARQLAGIGEPLAPAPVAKPLRMDFKRINVSKLQKDIDPRRTRTSPPPPYKMGSPPDEPGREDSEPLHTVWFERDFMLKSTEVTWAEWNTALDSAQDTEFTDISPGQNGQGGGEDDRHPVLGITWWDAIKWCNLASRLHNKKAVYYTHPSCKPDFILTTGTPTEIHVDWNADGYRLPTEAEWEFACRPGSSKRAFHNGPIRHTEIEPVDRNLDDAGWFGGNSKGGTHPVAGKKPNSLGLYDMHGNAAEWCWDLAGQLGPADAFDPRGAGHGVGRIIRGGSWLDPAKHCRAAARGTRNANALPNPSVGFRPAMTLPLPEKR